MAGFRGFQGLVILVFLMVCFFDNLGSSVNGLPVKPPAKSPRTLIAVEGVIYCKSCKFIGYDTLLGATPLPGAVAKLQCNNSKRGGGVASGTADKNGYFFIQAPPKVTNYAFHKCKVILVSSPIATCKNATNLHDGKTGAALRFQKVLTGPKPVSLYTVGPLAFSPANASSCPH